MRIRVRGATAEDLPDARRMLLEAGLPVSDLIEGRLAFVAETDERVVGVIGFEPLGRVGLLRSLVVAANARFSGLGRMLVAELETSARAQGIEEIWLLTIDADQYFAGLGYSICQRADAPQAIQGTAEFVELCPDDAALMCKSLQEAT